jgi:hypothetical protein
MRDLVRLIVRAVGDLFRSRAAIEAEILTLRQQIIVLRRTALKKQSFGAIDWLVFVGLYRLFLRVLDALAIVRPATVIKWHRAGCAGAGSRDRVVAGHQFHWKCAD